MQNIISRKMSLITRLLLVVVAIGFAHSLKPCCISKIYFGKLKVTTGTVKPDSNQTVFTENKLDFEYDEDLQMDRATGSIYNSADNSTHGYMVINDFRNGRRYSLVDQDQTCHVEPINPDQLSPHCVPPSLVWTGEFVVGSSGEEMKINSWAGSVDNFMYSMQTTVNDCTPVSLTRFGSDEQGNRILENILYVNVTQYHHSRPDVFTLPKQCQNPMPGAVGK